VLLSGSLFASDSPAGGVMSHQVVGSVGMVARSTWSVFVAAELAVSSALAKLELGSVFLNISVRWVVIGTSGHVNTCLGSQVLSAARHRVDGLARGGSDLSFVLVVARPRRSAVVLPVSG